MSFFNINFWQGAIGNMIGAWVGVVIAFWWERRNERRIKTAARANLLLSLSLALKQSSELLKRLNDGLRCESGVAGQTTVTTAYTQIPVTAFDVTAVEKYEIFDYHPVCGRIEAAVLGIKEINQEIDGLNRIYPLCLTVDEPKLNQHAYDLVQQITHQIPYALESLKETDNELDAMHDEQKRRQPLSEQQKVPAG